MEQKEAQHGVINRWLLATERIFGCPAEIDESLTEEFEWGWVFYLVPPDPDACKQVYKRARFACDRTNGISVPVGTKGLEQAVHQLMKFRSSSNG
jgi:hypothetical protein